MIHNDLSSNFILISKIIFCQDVFIPNHRPEQIAFSSDTSIIKTLVASFVIALV